MDYLVNQKKFNEKIIKKMTLEEYKEIIVENKPTIVKFYADWCKPCKSVASIIEKIIEEYGDKIQVISINVDEDSYEDSIASYENVRNIPALLYYKNGQLRDKNIGIVTKEIIDNKLLSLL